MTKEVSEKLEYVNSILKIRQIYSNACAVIGFDMETICPQKGMSNQGETSAYLGNESFKLSKDPKFIDSYEYLYKHLDELGEFDQVLIKGLHKDYVKEKNITPELDLEWSKAFNQSWVNWLTAKEKDDYSIFAPSLKEVRDICLKSIELNEEKKTNTYDNLLDSYESGITSEDLDKYFDECKERLIPLLKKIKASPKKIRTDFLSRPVSDEQQRKLADYLLEVIGFDFTRGAISTTEHPFTNGLAKDDVRVTTHYYPTAFTSSMYSVIHEGGHALFEMYQPEENFSHYINNRKTMGMHESTSRFYENRIGRSKEFIHLIYPKCKDIFPNVFYDVSEKEFYEAVNLVEPSLIRTEADEFTYTFHIIIRYELEKEIMNNGAKIEDLPKMWDDKYEEYLGIRPSNYRDGVLQDVHWASGFGYFPTYALGNMYNAMYYNKMSEEINIAESIKTGNIKNINNWMIEHVWNKADRLEPKQWIKEITGKDFTPKDFLDYLETKYSELYEF